MEHGLEYITIYVQKHMASLAVCSGLQLVRDEPLGAPAFVRFAYCDLACFLCRWFDRCQCLLVIYFMNPDAVASKPE